MKKKVLDLIYKTHSQGVEKSIFMRDFILKHDRANFYDDIYDTLEFFYKHIPIHFAYEEVVINTLLKGNNLTKDEISLMDRILGEHKTLTMNFEKIKELAAKIEKVKNHELKEDFMEIVNETIYSLIKHAELEDERLYPLIEAKADGSLLVVVEKEISRIII